MSLADRERAEANRGLSGLAARGASALLRRITAGTEVSISGDATGHNSKPFEISVPPPGAALRIATDPEYWVPASFVRGDWALLRGDLGDFATYMLDRKQGRMTRRFSTRQRRSLTANHFIQHWLRPLTSTRSVRRHYDIDPRVYEYILDPEMLYTAAFFEGTDDLATAQQIKMARAVERLQLAEDARVLEIGMGWGGFARHLVRNHPGASTCGLTISTEQRDWARAHNAQVLSPAERARTQPLLEDFRDHRADQPYDGIVSFGLFEHVGQRLYADFFQRCHDMLKPGARMLVHTIVKNRSNSPTNRWIDTHIFPGGYIPSVAEATRGAEAAELNLTAVHLHGPENYAETCRQWRQNLMANRSALLALYCEDLGLSQAEALEAYRTWEIYLAGAEAGFRVKRRPMQTAQLVFQRPTSDQ